MILIAVPLVSEIAKVFIFAVEDARIYVPPTFRPSVPAFVPHCSVALVPVKGAYTTFESPYGDATLDVLVHRVVVESMNDRYLSPETLLP